MYFGIKNYLKSTHNHTAKHNFNVAFSLLVSRNGVVSRTKWRRAFSFR